MNCTQTFQSPGALRQHKRTKFHKSFCGAHRGLFEFVKRNPFGKLFEDMRLGKAHSEEIVLESAEKTLSLALAAGFIDNSEDQRPRDISEERDASVDGDDADDDEEWSESGSDADIDSEFLNEADSDSSLYDNDEDDDGFEFEMDTTDSEKLKIASAFSVTGACVSQRVCVPDSIIDLEDRIIKAFDRTRHAEEYKWGQFRTILTVYWSKQTVFGKLQRTRQLAVTTAADYACRVAKLLNKGLPGRLFNPEYCDHLCVRSRGLHDQFIDYFMLNHMT